MTAAREKERIRAPRAGDILGVETRTVQAMAQRRELPGAAKIGGVWTFDEAVLRNWLKDRTTCPSDRRRQNTPIGAATRFGRDSPLQVAKSVKASELALRRLRRGG